MNSVAVRPTFRPAYVLLTTFLLAVIVFESVKHGFTWQLPVFAWAPDLALVLGAGRGLAKGQLHPRAVRLYNAVHTFWPPLALAVAAAALGLPLGWFVAAIAWAFHVALDRALGYGLRTPEGFQRA